MKGAPAPPGQRGRPDPETPTLRPGPAGAAGRYTLAMPGPFPGMDPYLEHPALWPDVHNRLIAELGNTLGPLLRPRYYVRLEERTYLSEPEGLVFVGRPDLTVERRGRPPSAGPAPDLGQTARALAVEVPIVDRVRETYLEVRAVERGEVVTVLEALSPANKVPGRGRTLYEDKRQAVLGTRTSLVEIDLLRSGQPMHLASRAPDADYRILVSRGELRPVAELLVFSVRDPIPVFRLPLRRGDDEPIVDIGALLSTLYDRAAYDLSIDYRTEPVPPLAGESATWADALLRTSGRR